MAKRSLLLSSSFPRGGTGCIEAPLAEAEIALKMREVEAAELAVLSTVTISVVRVS
jgi:hypothetical protein